MPTTVGTTAQLDSALRRGFSEASVRVAPTTTMTSVVEALATMGIEVGIQDGVLVMSQGTTQFNTSLALRNFAARAEHKQFFVQEGGHPAQWSKEKKLEYLSTHSDEDYRKMFQSPVLDSGVKVLDANMSRADYANLTTREKMQFIKEFGDAGVSQVMAKAK